MWLIRTEDILEVEAAYRLLTRCETVDACALRAAPWVAFRAKLVRFLSGTLPMDPSPTFRAGETHRIGEGVRVMILGVYPEDGVLELDVFLE